VLRGADLRRVGQSAVQIVVSGANAAQANQKWSP
jgi:hypothetical protein